MNENKENKFQGDELPGMDEPPLVANFDHVQIHTHPEKFNFEIEGTTYEGYLSYTEGLEETLTYEIAAFSAELPTEEDEFGLRGTAAMMSVEMPHLIPIIIPMPVRERLHERGIPENVMVQVVLDHHALENDGPTRPETAEWGADGGLRLFDLRVFTGAVEQFFQAMDQQMQERAESLMALQRKHIEEVGFTQVGVFDPQGIAPVFIYTVGLTNMGLPELFISGRFDPQALSHIVGQAVTRFKEMGKFEVIEFERNLTIEVHGEEHEISVRAVPLSDSTKVLDNYMTRASMILGKPIEAVALLQLADLNGRYPDDPEFDNIFGQIEVQ